ncbi:Vi polysaccharide biosynthesis UDP-N-acetylglucosamine C-6 dehydrogenase TviB [Rhodanobacter sp. FDAARGOS 1247]|uniref:Vi polysaccharide biosynthesis UDP-N-acetylglucosamine C-6 dehydrogenase TviB n=1 Tax=Rhodanobacter sp. FDAARGOS 1247 TaxID=2778082 RepID=UPI001950CB3A|nr:Vi polysaccharide biosynthesis UDP-N-acetylglucosamine C-6 dehydrogenase TviB [Rhodanobacter sp. FDAARGOS 1247]QRP65564.1 Vi polysaccharide biosynthesis UDP-N-acetylglucosamine C-6 dehydrogenase TviB [Rhodanobacter sp. FDAARGOS 1247]
MRDLDQVRIAVVGLGYVGLPLAVEFGKHFNTVGFDIHTARIEQLRAGIDFTQETSVDELEAATKLTYTDELQSIRDCGVFIVSVPTPVDEHKRPDFTPLIKASESIGSVLKRGDVVVYESTVYPGATEEICVPELERISGLKFNIDFTVGYSPERINPGDKQRRLTNIPKITSGSTPETAEYVDALYRTIITAGTHKASSLKVAEAAKVIENTQRDANIALINEFALIFHRLGIDTQDVLEAAGTKWNFLPFQPGLVGGHCIGVDPYYLIQKAQAVGYFPDILLACRRINDGMGQHVASEVVKLMIGKGHAIKGSRVLVLGLTFKENCPDLRNTRVVDLIAEFESYGAVVDIYDPWADAIEAKREYGLSLLAEEPKVGAYDAVVLAVAHDEFKPAGANRARAWANGRAVLYDIKGVLPRNEVDGRL